MILPLLFPLAVLCAAAPGGEQLDQLYHWCSQSRKCASAYHVSTSLPYNRETFEYLLRLRLDPHRNESSLHSILAKAYEMRNSHAIEETPTLRAHWLTLLLAAAPHCLPCNDAMPADIGAQCDQESHSLRFDPRTNSLICSLARKSVTVATAAEQTPLEEQWHTPLLTSIPIWLLAGLIAISTCMRTVYHSQLILAQRAKRKP